MEFLNVKLWVFFFVFIRLLGVTLFIPYFSMNLVPKPVKIFILIFLSYIVAIGLNDTFPIDGNFLMIVYLFIVNFLVGMIIGIIMHIIFYAVELAGQFFGIQMGFALANVLDPMYNTQVSIMSELGFLLSTFVFFIFKGHIWLYMLTIEMFKKIPSVFIFNGKDLGIFVSKISEVFVMGVQLSLPVTAFMIFTTLSLGIVNRLIPQLNAFIVGMPLKIIVGFLIFMAVIQVWQEYFTKTFFELYHWLEKTLIIVVK
ncbi:flagellar biosynthetic protein FliR [Tepiditoga spiralis]|uniref:Flagellar biosynthetic protein FliR n=1 Tax=Tepiditoga spiralis TaxID=2108365 RepID=A0A7G1G4K0_9BACT|nr:flagellar biosynthetic protein FliR [Tepiditoga spiralis]BBE31301.1 flagellar biosynthetic protein FliR [Tepiditoga spiralis]